MNTWDRAEDTGRPPEDEDNLKWRVLTHTLSLSLSLYFSLSLTHSLSLAPRSLL